MWKVNYQTLIMMTADQPRYLSGEESEQRTTREEPEADRPAKGQKNALAYFQSRKK